MGGVVLNVLRGKAMFACGKRYALAFLLCVGVVGAASGQSVPLPKEFYFDSDPMAVPMRAIDGAPDDLVDQLMRQRNRGRRAVESTVQLADIAMVQSRMDLAVSLYNEAAALGNSAQVRGVRWNQGWAQYRQGDAGAALQAWVQALQSTRLLPTWAPPTLALGLWQSGRRQEAVLWYAAAVRTEPQLWSDPQRIQAQVPDWHDDEVAVLRQVQQAWAANPPAWPLKKEDRPG